VRPLISLREALSDANLLGGVLDGPSWFAWRVLLCASMGEPLTEPERVVFAELTGRPQEPLRRVEEFVGVIGRRGGKSRAAAAIAAYIAALCRHKLVPGERGLLLCIAPDQRQATITLDYAAAAFEGSPLLRPLIASRSSDSLSLSNGIDIEVRSASFRRLRGPTFVAVIADEAAFWYADDGSANPDSEILNAVRPGLATTGGLLAIISSPYARRGEVWDLYRRHFGPAGDPLILVAQAPSRTMNPALPQSVVDRALERDYAAASAEFLAQFRTDIEALLTREAVEACVSPGIRERPPISNARYFAFADPSGGSADSMTLAIGHKEGDVIFVDAVRERKPPFSPEDVVTEFAELLKSYRVTRIAGDRYAGEWPRERFQHHGISYDPAPKPKSDLYRDLLPLINGRRIDLLDSPRLISQLCGLERRTSRGGRDSIDHAPGAHDDIANSVAGLAAAPSKYRYDSTMSWVSGPDDNNPETANKAWQEARFARHIWANSGYRRF
jgi:hypothetical protein